MPKTSEEANLVKEESHTERVAQKSALFRLATKRGKFEMLLVSTLSFMMFV